MDKRHQPTNTPLVSHNVCVGNFFIAGPNDAVYRRQRHRSGHREDEPAPTYRIQDSTHPRGKTQKVRTSLSFHLMAMAYVF